MFEIKKKINEVLFYSWQLADCSLSVSQHCIILGDAVRAHCSWGLGPGKGGMHLRETQAGRTIGLSLHVSKISSAFFFYFCMVEFHLAFCLKKGFCYQKKTLKTTPRG